MEDLAVTLGRLEHALEEPPVDGTLYWEWRVVRHKDAGGHEYTIRRVYFDPPDAPAPTWIGPAYDPPRARFSR